MKLPPYLERVAELTSHGYQCKETAHRLGLSPHTVKAYRHQIYELIDVPRGLDPGCAITRWWIENYEQAKPPLNGLS